MCVTTKPLRLWSFVTATRKKLGTQEGKELHATLAPLWGGRAETVGIKHAFRSPQQWPQDWKRSVFIPITKKGNPKECSNYHTIALISHASNAQNSPSQALAIREPRTSRCSS